MCVRRTLVPYLLHPQRKKQKKIITYTLSEYRFVIKKKKKVKCQINLPNDGDIVMDFINLNVIFGLRTL